MVSNDAGFLCEIQLRFLTRLLQLGSRFMMREISRPQGEILDVFRLDLLNSDDVFEVSLESLQTHFKGRRFTSVDYVKFCLERISRISTPERNDIYPVY